MAATGESRWPRVGRADGRRWGQLKRPHPRGGQISVGAELPSSLGATLRSFGRQPPPASAPAAGLLLPLAPSVRDCAAFRGRGFCLPRTTAALAGPWALPIPPGAVLRGPRLGDGSVPVTIAGRIPRLRARASLISMVGRLDLGASPPPLPVCVWLSRHPGPATT